MSYFKGSSHNDAQKYKDMTQMARESFEKNVLNKRFHQYNKDNVIKPKVKNKKMETIVNSINKTSFEIVIKNHTPILSYREIDSIEDELKMKLPEMTFVNNSIAIKYNDTYEYRIDSMSLMDSVKREVDETIKVSNSKHWDKHKEKHGSQKNGMTTSNDNTEEDGLNFDWTYTPVEYIGKIQPLNKNFDINQVEVMKEDKSKIPFLKLAQQLDIKKFDTILHFEDELNDNGISLSYSKIRVVDTKVPDHNKIDKKKKMKYTYILTRFFLRVDNVMVRVIDLRTYFNLKKPNKIIIQQDVFEKRFEENTNDLSEINKLKSFESVLDHEHQILKDLDKVDEKTQYLTINLNI